MNIGTCPARQSNVLRTEIKSQGCKDPWDPSYSERQRVSDVKKVTPEAAKHIVDSAKKDFAKAIALDNSVWDSDRQIGKVDAWLNGRGYGGTFLAQYKGTLEDGALRVELPLNSSRTGPTTTVFISDKVEQRIVIQTPFEGTTEAVYSVDTTDFEKSYGHIAHCGYRRDNPEPTVADLNAYLPSL